MQFFLRRSLFTGFFIGFLAGAIGCNPLKMLCCWSKNVRKADACLDAEHARISKLSSLF
jgi:hypothetical protein